MTITTDSQGASPLTSNDNALNLIFTSSENTNNFTKDDIDVTKDGVALSGADKDNVLSALTPQNPTNGFAKVYTATLTQNGDATYVVSVPVGSAGPPQTGFQDSAGNYNTPLASFTWNCDRTSPTPSISVARSSNSDPVNHGDPVNEAVVVTIDTRENTTDLELADIVVAPATHNKVILLVLIVFILSH